MSIKDFTVDFDANAGLMLGEIQSDESTDNNAQSKALGMCGSGWNCAGGGGQCSSGWNCTGG
ncbi:MAG: hypothetical protein IJ685_07025 [Selenomonadaceae bacterium]|nr:hypothetical protein [Selenomonadaceae bacterium]